MDEHRLQSRSNHIFKTIQTFERLFPDEFEKCGIKQCGHCNATGISNKHSLEHCSNCGGMGYVGYEKLHGEHVCRSCNGYGCGMCNYNGTVDWVTHARSSDIIPGPEMRRRA